jgi:hypothetical protein
MRIFVEPSYAGESVDQIVRHALDIVHAAGVFLNVGGGVFDGRALVLVEPDDTARAILALEKAEMRAFRDQP